MPKQLGLSLFVVAQGLPDLAYVLLLSGLVALVWGIVRTIWAYATLRAAARSHGDPGPQRLRRREPVMSTPASRLHATEGGLALYTGTLRRETALFLMAVGVVGLHIVDDNFLQPEPGTSAGDHLASGLIPIVVLVIVAAAYPRLRAGLRAITAMTFGALAIAVGVPAVYYLLDGNSAGTTSRPARDRRRMLTARFRPVTLWKARRTGGSRRRRYLRRALIAVATPVLAWAIVWFIVFPIGFAYIYIHTGRSAVTPNLGVPYESVTVVTSDRSTGCLLRPLEEPRSDRAVPGRHPLPEARMLIRHGYGVLLLDPRGQGSSEGDTVRWAGDRDLLAAAAYLRNRPDVDPDRIGGFGFSIGGEILIEAAAQRPRSRRSSPRAQAVASATTDRPACWRSQTSPS